MWGYIRFVGTTNKEYEKIKSATFLCSDGTKRRIGRRTTYLRILDGSITMEWENCYHIRDGYNVDFNFVDYEEMKSAKLVSLEYEEDADADYAVEITSCETTAYTYCCCA